MTARETSRVAEDYVTLIWKAGEWPDDGRKATTSDLAASLGVTLSTVSANLKKLAREELIHYEPYGTISLSEEGERMAVDVVRRHRLIETFLVEHLGYRWDEVHDEADRLEHAASDLLIERIDATLGHPEVDPHGDPIPQAGAMGRADGPVTARILTRCEIGQTVQVVRVSDTNPDVLRFLADRGIRVGSTLQIVTPMTATGLMTVQSEDQAIEMSLPIAGAVHVDQVSG